jgi:hypothetical protein
MKDNLFDNYFKEQLSQHSSNVPDGLWDKVSAGNFDAHVKDSLEDFISPVPAGLWKKIKPEDEDDRKPFIFWWFAKYGWVAALLVLLAGGAGYFAWKNAKQEPSTTKTGVDNLNNNTLPNNETATNSNLNGAKDESSKSNTPPLKVDDTKPNITNTNEDATATKDKVSKKPISVAANHRQPYFTKHSNKKATTIVSDDNNIVANAGGIKTKGKQPLKNKKFTLGTPTQQLNNLVSTTNNGNEALEQYLQASNASSAKFTKGEVMLSMLGMLQNKKAVQAINFAKLPSVPCPGEGPTRNDLYIEVYGSPDFVRKSLTPEIGATNNFINLKDSTETLRTSYTAGVRLAKTLGNHFLVKTGLQFSQINEKFYYRTENERRLVTVITIRTVTLSNGTTTTISDTSMVLQIGYREKTTYNRYRSVDVPLLLSYEFGNYKFKAAINAGPIFNLYSWYKGDMIDTSGYQVVSVDGKSGNRPYKQNIGVGLYAGISLLAKINNNTQFFVEPYLRYNLSNMTTNSYLYTQKFTTYGVSFGIRKRLASFGQHYPGN